jgi:hypothetical protein
MPYNNVLRLFLVLVGVLSLRIPDSFSLTKSVDLFGEINSVDLVLNDIWIEPENPRGRDNNGTWLNI